MYRSVLNSIRSLTGKYATPALALLCAVSAGVFGSLPPAAVKTQTRTTGFAMNYHFAVKGSPSWVSFTALIPKTIPGRQTVRDIRFSVTPSRIFEANGNRYAEFVLRNPKGDLDVNVEAAIDMHGYSLAAADGAVSPSDLNYLAAEQYIEKDSDVIQGTVREMRGRDELETVKKIYDYVISTVKYCGYVPQDNGAARVMERKEGDCSDYSDVLVAMCRARGIPARIIDGYLTTAAGDDPKHTWVEVFIKGYGWVPVDPLLGHLKQASFGTFGPKYIFLSTLRNDPVLDNYHFYTCRYSGGRVQVTESYTIGGRRGDVVAMSTK